MRAGAFELPTLVNELRRRRLVDQLAPAAVRRALRPRALGAGCLGAAVAAAPQCWTPLVLYAKIDGRASVPAETECLKRKLLKQLAPSEPTLKPSWRVCFRPYLTRRPKVACYRWLIGPHCWTFAKVSGHDMPYDTKERRQPDCCCRAALRQPKCIAMWLCRPRFGSNFVGFGSAKW